MHPEVLSEKHNKILPLLKNFGSFYLAGGTALALQIGHRISVDFDLFTDKPIEKKLFDIAKRAFAGRKIRPLVDNKDELTILVDDIKITFLRYPFPALLPKKKVQGVNLLSVKEIAATKAYTIGRRGAFKDYIDLYFVIKDKFCSLKEAMRLAKQKFSQEFNERLFLEQLAYFDDIEDVEIIFVREKIDKAGLAKFFEREIKKIL